MSVEINDVYQRTKILIYVLILMKEKKHENRFNHQKKKSN